MENTEDIGAGGDRLERLADGLEKYSLNSIRQALPDTGRSWPSVACAHKGGGGG